MNNKAKEIVDNIENVIVGKRKQVSMILLSMICKGHVLIEDVPGVGKTSIVSSLAKSMNMTFRRIQFTPDIMPSDITGFTIFNQKTGDFEYHEGLVMSNILLADEINRTSPKTQSSLLEAMEEKQVTVDGKTYRLPNPFIVLATQNPVEHLGTYPLPEAQLDRFFLKISIGYPSSSDESRILEMYGSSNPWKNIAQVASAEDVVCMQNDVTKIHVDKNINEYIVAITNQTRTHPSVLLGASPRGSICLYRAAQGLAYLSGRDYCLPDDVKVMAPYVLSHRLVLRHEARVKKQTAEAVINSLIETVAVPVA